MVELSVNIAGLQLANPVILASGVLGETGKSMEKLARAGIGAVTTKSIGTEPRPGHDNPTIVELEYGLLNAMGLPNPGIDAYLEELEHILARGVPLLGSIFGKDDTEFARLAGIMSGAGVHALELNLSCPHAAGYGAELGSDPIQVEKITKAVKDAVDIPVFVKLTPNTADIVSLGRAAVTGGCDGLVAINTVKGMALAADVGKPILSNTFGGYSGPGIKPIGLRCIHELARSELGVPLIGVGGIMTGTDIAEYLMAGASAIQAGSVVYYRGKGVFGTLVNELEQFMTGHGYNSVNEMVGIAIEK